MKCRHFGECGSCTLYAVDYAAQVGNKAEKLRKLLAPFYHGEIETHTSPDSHYRARAEFRIWHEGERCDYAMGNLTKDGSVLIEECPKVLSPIAERMGPLLEAINDDPLLAHKLFAVEFLSATTEECLITLLYHRPLDAEWERKARELEKELGASILGRARKQRLVLSRDYVTEALEIEGRKYLYRHYEGGFTQPNPFVNARMITWAREKARRIGGGDLLEAYCGLEFHDSSGGEFRENSSHRNQQKLHRRSQRELCSQRSGKHRFRPAELRGDDIRSPERAEIQSTRRN